MDLQRFTVRGMTCAHCVQAVTHEICGLPGVERVDIELSTGAVSVAADRPIGRSELAAGVEEAGYELVTE